VFGSFSFISRQRLVNKWVLQIGVYLFVSFYVLFSHQREKSTKRGAAKGRNQGFSLWEPSSFHGGARGAYAPR
jgi:hypothetical protein